MSIQEITNLKKTYLAQIKVKEDYLKDKNLYKLILKKIFIYSKNINSDLIEIVSQPLSGWLGHSDPFAFDRKYFPANNINKYINPMKIPFTFRMHPTLHDF